MSVECQMVAVDEHCAGTQKSRELGEHINQLARREPMERGRGQCCVRWPVQGKALWKFRIA